MPLLLDTSVLIRGLDPDPADEVAISAVSLSELHFGVLVASDEDRADRLRLLAAIEDAFDPLPFDARAARECGRLHAAVVQRGGGPRRRAFDLAIANVYGVPLLTLNAADLKLVEDLVDIQSPGRP